MKAQKSEKSKATSIPALSLRWVQLETESDDEVKTFEERRKEVERNREALFGKVERK